MFQPQPFTSVAGPATQKLQKIAYRKGYVKGFAVGRSRARGGSYKSGYAVGRSRGYKSGYRNGSAAQKRKLSRKLAALKRGQWTKNRKIKNLWRKLRRLRKRIRSSYRKGYSKGYRKGKSVGYRSGHRVGYRKGRRKNRSCRYIRRTRRWLSGWLRRRYR